MADAVNWKEARDLNRVTYLVAAPGIHVFSVDTDGTKVVFQNFTRSIKIQPTDGDVFVAIAAAGLDAATNKWSLESGDKLEEVMEVPSICIAAQTGTVSVQLLVVLGNTAVPSGFGEMAQANGFDGCDATGDNTLVTLGS